MTEPADAIIRRCFLAMGVIVTSGVVLGAGDVPVTDRNLLIAGGCYVLAAVWVMWPAVSAKIRRKVCNR